MPRTLRSSTSEQIGQMSTPLEKPQTRSRAGTRNAEPEQTTSDHYVPSGSERMIDQLFAIYGWRERSHTMYDLRGVASSDFWTEQGVIPEEWGVDEMTKKRSKLSRLLHVEDQDSIRRAKYVNKLQARVQQDEGIDFVTYVRPGATHNGDNEANESDSDEASEVDDTGDMVEESEGSEAGFTAKDIEAGDSSDAGGTAEETDADNSGDTTEEIYASEERGLGDKVTWV
ncbi:hypothetical protein CBER1_06540 [Cercospora berteroae]|uniref:Uncharacterized protein n=1 Tax=Cercospora berteroae TaxID=357750 RepID=A0A2S6BTY7_9PEZI|nr:hypothetical protein CBER1_06540 [Cercospora berteroae]